jgi:hypothetical protein
LFRKIAHSNITSKQRQVNQIKSDILSDFDDTPSFEQVDINGAFREVHIVTDKKDNKVMLSKPDENFCVGDVVSWYSNKFLVVDIDENQQIQTKGTIQLCNNTIKFYDQNHIICEIPCIISKNINLSNEENRYLTTIDNEFYLTLPNNSTTQQIKVNDIYKIGMSNYQISSVPDDISQQGLLIFKVKYSEQSQEIHNYSIVILNGSSVTIQEGYTLQLNCNVFDNGKIVEDGNHTELMSKNGQYAKMYRARAQWYVEKVTS